MLKRNITYTDFNGEEVTETFYFNISKTELVELELNYEGGLQKAIQRIIKTEDSKALVAEFKKIILLAYGEKSEDGKRFIKSDHQRYEFEQTAAFDALFMELATNEDAAVNFLNGVIPKDLAGAVAQAAAPQTPQQYVPAMPVPGPLSHEHQMNAPQTPGAYVPPTITQQPFPGNPT